MTFDDLSAKDKKVIYGYTFIVRVLPDLPDNEIRGIFQRLNKNVVALNAQELRQATYWGPFIKTMQEVSNYNYWSTSGIFTPANVRRMLDIEYISELAVAVLHGHQNKKESLDEFYLRYEEEFERRGELVDTFKMVLFEVEQLLPDIKNTRWRKKTDFYSLFMFLADKQKQFPLSVTARKTLRNKLDTFAAGVDQAVSTSTTLPSKRKKPVTEPVANYVAAIRASTDVANRRRRHLALEAALGSTFARDSRGTLDVKIQPTLRGLFDSRPDEEEE